MLGDRPAIPSRGNMIRVSSITLPIRDYDLAATLSSGQVFNWEHSPRGWSGVVQGRWVRLVPVAGAIQVQAAESQSDWTWLTHFLQTEINLAEILATFPSDEHLQAAVRACRGLRLLRQDPWECLASFILSSTKQIVQIRQIVRLLSERYGERIKTDEAGGSVFAFPNATRIAALNETELRDCKMGFRAPYLLAAARRITAGEIALAALHQMPLAEAKAQLLRLDGVGEKIADCVLLFAYGFPEAFPVDVWVRRVLTQYYFRNRAVRPERLRRFITQHFGANAGYCQQYLFHHIRISSRKVLSGPAT
jgi:N-glycosylase/DNA lyase